MILVLDCTSQQERDNSIKISKTKTAQVTTLHDLIPVIPSNCKVKSAIVGFSHNSSLREFTCKGDTFSKDFVNVLKQCKEIFVEDLKTDCNSSLKRSYKIIIE